MAIEPVLSAAHPSPDIHMGIRRRSFSIARMKCVLREQRLMSVVSVFCAKNRYLQMVFYAHGSLRNWIVKTQPDHIKRRSVLRQTLLAVTYIHAQVTPSPSRTYEACRVRASLVCKYRPLTCVSSVGDRSLRYQRRECSNCARHHAAAVRLRAQPRPVRDSNDTGVWRHTGFCGAGD